MEQEKLGRGVVRRGREMCGGEEDGRRGRGGEIERGREWGIRGTEREVKV